MPASCLRGRRGIRESRSPCAKSLFSPLCSFTPSSLFPLSSSPAFFRLLLFNGRALSSWRRDVTADNKNLSRSFARSLSQSSSHSLGFLALSLSDSISRAPLLSQVSEYTRFITITSGRAFRSLSPLSCSASPAGPATNYRRSFGTRYMRSSAFRHAPRFRLSV